MKLYTPEQAGKAFTLALKLVDAADKYNKEPDGMTYWALKGARAEWDNMPPRWIALDTNEDKLEIFELARKFRQVFPLREV